MAPGYIDLSQLRFWAIDDGLNDDFSDPDGDDDVYLEGDDEVEGGGGNLRLLDEEDGDDSAFSMNGSALDIAVFNLVSIINRESTNLALFDKLAPLSYLVILLHQACIV